MLDKQGSILVNVLIVAIVLMILGLGALQLVLSDSTFAKTNFNAAQALQLAEGGIELGIEVLLEGNAEFGKEYELDLGHDGNVKFVVEPHPTLDQHYEITSWGEKASTKRRVQLLVKYHFWEGAFTHSLFTGNDGETMSLKNVVIMGDTYIGTRIVDLSHVYFKGDTHFAGERVTMSNTCDKDPWTVITRGPETDIIPPNHHHWTNSIDIEENREITFPEIDLGPFSRAEGFYNWGKKNRIGYQELKGFNFFEGDIQVDVDKNLGLPLSLEITIVSTGEVKFVVNNQLLNSYSATLIILAENDIVDVDKLTPGAQPHNKDDPDQDPDVNGVQLYLYSRNGLIATTQNIRLRAVMAKYISIQCSQYQTIREPDPTKISQLLHDAWRRSLIRVKWSN